MMKHNFVNKGDKTHICVVENNQKQRNYTYDDGIRGPWVDGVTREEFVCK